jgi:hypothetical protein
MKLNTKLSAVKNKGFRYFIKHIEVKRGSMSLLENYKSVHTCKRQYTNVFIHVYVFRSIDIFMNEYI